MALPAILGITTLVGAENSMQQTNAFNAQASQTAATETQLLQEAQANYNQQQATPGLIAQRTAQEQTLDGSSTWNATGTLLTPAAKVAQDTNPSGVQTPTTNQLGI